MSHTYDGDKGARFHYNPDMSGEVWISDGKGRKVTIEGSDLKDFLVSVVLSPRFEMALESALIKFRAALDRGHGRMG